MNRIFLPINIMVTTSRAHLITTPKNSFSIDIHNKCVAFYFTSDSSLMTVLIQENSWSSSTNCTQLLDIHTVL